MLFAAIDRFEPKVNNAAAGRNGSKAPKADIESDQGSPSRRSNRAQKRGKTPTEQSFGS